MYISCNIICNTTIEHRYSKRRFWLTNDQRIVWVYFDPCIPLSTYSQLHSALNQKFSKTPPVKTNVNKFNRTLPPLVVSYCWWRYSCCSLSWLIKHEAWSTDVDSLLLLLLELVNFNGPLDLVYSLIVWIDV